MTEIDITALEIAVREAREKYKILFLQDAKRAEAASGGVRLSQSVINMPLSPETAEAEKELTRLEAELRAAEDAASGNL